MTFTVVLTAVLFLITMFLWVYSPNKKNADLPPGPWNLPFLGSLLWLDPQAPHISLTKLSKKYGPIYSLRLGKLLAVVVSDASLAKQILMKDESSGTAHLYLFDTMTKGKGIVFAEGELWKDQRKFLSNFLKAAGTSKISPNKSKLHNLVKQRVDNFVQYIKDRGDRVVLDPLEILVHNVGSIQTSLFLGKCWDQEDIFWKHLLHLLDEGSKLAAVAGPLNFLPVLRFLPPYKKVFSFLFKVYDTIYTTYAEIVDDSKKGRKDSTPFDPNLVDVFLRQISKSETKEIYNEKQLSALLVDVFAASIETTTNTLLWIILYLAEYKEVQDELRQELLDNVQDNVPTIDDLANLPLMEATIAEVSRIRTVIPLGIPHSALDDIQIEKFRIPKGCIIMTFLWGIHMNPKHWKDPYDFRPERFLDDTGRFYIPETFMPFQSGKRRCIGEELARIVIFQFLSAILKNFQINSSVECEVDLSVVCGLTLKPKPQSVVFIKL